jgi:hypothetical protein
MTGSMTNIAFKVFDKNGIPVGNAEVRANGQLAPYDGTTGLHTIAGKVSDTIDLEIKAPGFQLINQKGMAALQRPSEIYLGKEGDPWYIDVNGIPVAYSYRPRDIFVVLRDRPAGQPIQIDHVKTEILSLPGLEDYKVLEVDWKAGLSPKSLSHRTGNRILLRAPEDLPASRVPALASLRKQAWVRFAGPLIVHGEAYGHATAPGTKLNVYPNTQKIKNYEEGSALARQWGCSYNVQEGVMVFESDAGSVVIEAAKEIVLSGLFSVVEMEVYRSIELD